MMHKRRCVRIVVTEKEVEVEKNLNMKNPNIAVGLDSKF